MASLQPGQEVKASTVDFLAWADTPDSPEVQRARMFYDFTDNAIKVIDSNGTVIFNSASGSGVTSVFGRTGDITAQSADYSAFYVSLSPGTNQTITSGSLIFPGAVLTAVAPTVSAGQVGFGSTTAATATAGGGQAALATVAGYLIVNVAGVSKRIPYFNA